MPAIRASDVDTINTLKLIRDERRQEPATNREYANNMFDGVVYYYETSIDPRVRCAAQYVEMGWCYKLPLDNDLCPYVGRIQIVLIFFGTPSDTAQCKCQSTHHTPVRSLSIFRTGSEEMLSLTRLNF